MRKAILTLFIFCVYISAIAQKDIDTMSSIHPSSDQSSVIDFSQIALYPIVGASYQFPIGESIRSYNNSTLQKNIIEDDLTVTSDFISEPTLSALIGIRASIPITERGQVGFGMQFIRRGFGLDASVLYQNPEVQRDELFNYHADVRVNCIELPLWFDWQWLEKTQVGGGVSLGFPLKNSANEQSYTLYDVILNGQRDQSWSVPKEEYSRGLHDSIKGIYPSFFVQLSYTLPYNFKAIVEIQYNRNYIQLENGGVSSASLAVILAYRIR